jgi:hypothetical protein
MVSRKESTMNQHVDRRDLIASSTAIALAADMVAPTQSEAGTELPVDRVNAAAWELADALNSYDDGRWYAEVHPSLPNDYPVAFRSIAARAREADGVRTLARVMSDHRRAFVAFERVCRLNDAVALGREPTEQETRLHERRDAAEDAALVALCEHRCGTVYEFETKARYLHVHALGGGLEKRHLDAVLRSSLPIATYDPRRPSEAGIEWVRQMQADGYVFVCRGHVCDLDSYAIRRDLDEGDDTKILLREMRRLARRRP